MLLKFQKTISQHVIYIILIEIMKKITFYNPQKNLMTNHVTAQKHTFTKS